jgi:anti-sigma factor ChrR (cupin superfamily)
MLPADSPFAPPLTPGPHPATAELRAYAAGTLVSAEEYRIEAHLLDCECCADLVEGFSMTDADTTDQAVAELRTRLQARVGTAEPAPAATRWAVGSRIAAAALLGAAAVGIWNWEQREVAPSVIATATTARPQHNAPAAPALPAPSPESAKPAPIADAEAPTPAPAAPTKADYAARLPTQSSRQITAPLARQRKTAASARIGADQKSLTNSETADAAPLTDAISEPAASEISGSAAEASLAEVTVTKENTELADKKVTAADTDAASPLAATQNRALAKAKALAPDLSAARVANTPMPAAPAIAPAPVGGTSALRDYLRREAAAFVPDNNAPRLTGSVRIKFVVGTDGKLSDLKITRGLRADYDAEALRIVCEGPAWQPGVAGGRRAPLATEVTVPF